jgi:glycosyltransferase involved in cell wall biosynthesis
MGPGKLKVHIIAPALPPKLDGIGDHSARLAINLTAVGADVTLLSPWDGPSADVIAGVRVLPSFSPEVRRSVWNLTEVIAAEKPDWVLLQYNPFSYGRRGLNLSLPRAFPAMRRRSPTTRLALFVHEESVPADTLKQAVMATWQRWQFARLAQAANVIFASSEIVTRTNQRRFPGKPIIHMPVGSNMPRVNIGRSEARARLGIEDGAGVLGMFGSAYSRLVQPMRHALDAAAAAGLNPMLLYIGSDNAEIRQAIGGHRLIADGPLPADEVSRRLSAVDVYLGGFDDGVSTRRGSWLAALQHGLACVGTVAYNTDEVFRAAARDGSIVLTDPADPHAFDKPVVELLSDRHRREMVAKAALELSAREFAWEHLAAKLLASLEAAS